LVTWQNCGQRGEREESPSIPATPTSPPYTNQCWASGSGGSTNFWTSRIQIGIRESKVLIQIRIRLRNFPLSHKGVGRTEIMLAKILTQKFCKRKETDMELEPDPDLLVRGADRRIRIRTKMSRISNTATNTLNYWWRYPYIKRKQQKRRKLNVTYGIWE